MLSLHHKLDLTTIGILMIRIAFLSVPEYRCYTKPATLNRKPYTKP